MVQNIEVIELDHLFFIQFPSNQYGVVDKATDCHAKGRWFKFRSDNCLKAFLS